MDIVMLLLEELRYPNGDIFAPQLTWTSKSWFPAQNMPLFEMQFVKDSPIVPG